jgi:hypothetical protein
MSIGFVEIINGKNYTLSSTGVLNEGHRQIVLTKSPVVTCALSPYNVVIVEESHIRLFDLQGNEIRSVEHSSTEASVHCSEKFIIVCSDVLCVYSVPSLRMVHEPIRLNEDILGISVVNWENKTFLLLMSSTTFKIYKLPHISNNISFGKVELLDSMTLLTDEFITLGQASAMVDKIIIPLGTKETVFFAFFGSEKRISNRLSISVPDTPYQIYLDDDHLIAQCEQFLYLWKMQNGILEEVNKIHLQGSTELVPKSLCVKGSSIALVTSQGLEKFQKISK